LLVVAGALLAFAGLADEIGETGTQKFDRKILLAMRHADDVHHPIGPEWLPEAARDITSLGSTAVLSVVTLSVVGFLLLSNTYGAAALVSASVFGGMFLVTALKHSFTRMRPDIVSHAARVFTTSFPSGHAALSAVTYLTLGALLARVQPHRVLKIYVIGVSVFFTLLVGVTRVYLGVHWPTDVLAGWCVGAAWAIGSSFLAQWLQRRGTIEQRVKPK